MYKFYRMLHNGKYKYTDTFNSTLDPNYHDLINYCRENDIRWQLIWTYDNSIKFKGQ